MNALILAAGYGSRLRALGCSKPLVEVAGLALIELSIRQAAAVGIGHVVVVTGHRAAQIEACLPAIAARAGVTSEACRLSDWSRPNGHSVVAGAARISGNYLLMMGDHIFQQALLARMMRGMDRASGATLAIDRNVTGATVDPADATWVRVGEGGRIDAIGKHLDRYDAVDCGAFVATPDLAAAIAQAVSEGAAGSLSEGMAVLARQGLAETMDVTGNWWIDVDDPGMHALAEAQAPIHLPELFGARLRSAAAS